MGTQNSETETDCTRHDCTEGKFPIPPTSCKSIKITRTQQSADIRVHNHDGYTAGLTHSDCLQLPLKSGGVLNLGWTHYWGGESRLAALADNWHP